MTSIAVSSTGRKFSNYPPSLDPNNTKYNVAELTSYDTEVPYPSVEINSPPGGFINYTTGSPAFVRVAAGANYQNYFLSVQSVVIDAKDRLWVLDSGRASTPTGASVLSSYGGPKLIGINISTNEVFTTILFPTTVAYSDSNFNDIRFDLRPSITPSGQGIAYITDSSTEGRNGIVTVDLGTSQSWRHLDNVPMVHVEFLSIPVIWGEPVYSITSTGRILSGADGTDGITLSSDGETLYWTAVGSRYLYSIPTARLRDNRPTSELMAQGAISSHGQVGTSDGLETDSNGLIYTGNFGQNAINIFDPATGIVSVFVRDPRIGWTDSMAVASDGYVYFTENQLWRTPSHYPGTDRRVRPFALFRAKVVGNGTKVQLM
ncbi:hypothetical protein OEA41_001703 [Lepraria neglecta]|uniref:Major royal jelly protein n=1 Tax=Lepraria neglecta TaxID=209136 RepID=A0AAD9ZCV2_9LECA|nr:hypothetical protein OEA41_001703 [Lepraria neglecta]